MRITITQQDGTTCGIEAGTTLREFWNQLETKPQDIEPVGAVLNQGLLCMMQEVLMEDATLTWVDRKSLDGFHIYRESIIMLLLKASSELFPDRRMIIQHTISNGIFCEFANVPTNEEEIRQLLGRMQELVAADLPIHLVTMTSAEASELFRKQRHYDTAELMRLYPEETVVLKELNGYYEYFFFDVLDHTGTLKWFRLVPYENGMVLQTPEEYAGKLMDFNEQKKLHHILKIAADRDAIMHTQTVIGVNYYTRSGRLDDLIRISEAAQDKEIARIADEICSDPRVQLVMIAGPSSSGKTSFAQKLSIQLRVNHKKPMTISMDNYFVDREKTPRDEKGEYDFENLDALDVELFNQQLIQLLKGESVQLPRYDFIQGKRLPDGPVVKLEAGQPLVIEGIHGLNERLTFRVPREQKRLIYISALTQLNLNFSNTILTSDCRLLRRIARDNRTRGHSVQDTIRRWPSVRRGEKKNIFVFQENADMFFNSELVYELAVLKPIVEPLLLTVKPTEPEYVHARRLLRFLHYILPVENPRVPYQSIIREFLGGSWYDVE